MIRMEVKGLDELERQLTAMGEKVATKVLRDAGREALRVVEEDMKQHAGFDKESPGPHMRDSIKISSRKGTAKYRSTVGTLRVGPSKKQQLAYFGIGTRTDISSFFLECLGSPRFQSPVFVI